MVRPSLQSGFPTLQCTVEDSAQERTITNNSTPLLEARLTSPAHYRLEAKAHLLNKTAIVSNGAFPSYEDFAGKASIFLLAEQEQSLLHAQPTLETASPYVEVVLADQT